MSEPTRGRKLHYPGNLVEELAKLPADAPFGETSYRWPYKVTNLAYLPAADQTVVTLAMYSMEEFEAYIFERRQAMQQRIADIAAADERLRQAAAAQRKGLH